MHVWNRQITYNKEHPHNKKVLLQQVLVLLHSSQVPINIIKPVLYIVYDLLHSSCEMYCLQEHVVKHPVVILDDT